MGTVKIGEREIALNQPADLGACCLAATGLAVAELVAMVEAQPLPRTVGIALSLVSTVPQVELGRALGDVPQEDLAAIAAVAVEQLRASQAPSASGSGKPVKGASNGE